MEELLSVTGRSGLDVRFASFCVFGFWSVNHGQADRKLEWVRLSVLRGNLRRTAGLGCVWKAVFLSTWLPWSEVQDAGEQDADPGTCTEPGPALVWAFSRIASAVLSELRMNSHPVSVLSCFVSWNRR